MTACSSLEATVAADAATVAADAATVAADEATVTALPVVQRQTFVGVA